MPVFLFRTQELHIPILEFSGSLGFRVEGKISLNII